MVAMAFGTSRDDNAAGFQAPPKVVEEPLIIQHTAGLDCSKEHVHYLCGGNSQLDDTAGDNVNIQH
jgi:uncharacterized protein YqfA (UPF0365 family)